MLGRQQIAGVSTAISELFKNAHDAYATWAVADYVRHQNLFVLRDNGIGMSQTQFEERWLTLGTAVKASQAADAVAPGEMVPRAVLGEKGIGRLAIAAIGPQVLVLTKSIDASVKDPATAALVHWSAFELPHVELRSIEIPVRQVREPGQLDITAMAESIAANVQQLDRDPDNGTVGRILRDLALWSAFDLAQLAETINVPTVLGDSGTCFIVMPASENLAGDLEAPGRKEAPPLLKTLIGFADTLTPEHPEPAVRTAFYDHRAPDLVTDLIKESEFFTPAEFHAADHHFRGTFDAYGQFDGTVQVFGGEPIHFPLAWTGARGFPTKCGPFRMDVGYVHGLRRQSGLEPAEWLRIVEKLDRFGGLYIYRDGIRVLPYGDTHFDWLNMELRRNKSASDAFFSYRRMFGAVQITRSHNRGLREKAGREGFAANEAYRQFRSILIQFFEKVAQEFFREDGARADEYEAGRLAHERLDKARQARSRQVRAKRQQLKNELERFFAAADADEPANLVAEAIHMLHAEVDRAGREADAQRAAAMVAIAERAANDKVRAVDDTFDIPRPRGVGLTSALQRDIQSYERERTRLREDVILPALTEIEKVVASVAAGYGGAINRRVRFDKTLESTTSGARAELMASRRDLTGVMEKTVEQSRGLSRDSFNRVDHEVQEVLSLATRLDVANMAEDEFIGQRDALEHRIRNVVAENIQAMTSVADQLRAIEWPIGGVGPLVTVADQVEELETRLEAFIERSEQDLELTQLGLAVEIINHEFQASIRGVRENLRRLKAWADTNRGLRPVYGDLRGAFDHLDGYLRLFTPLHRRLYRKPVEIRGRDIEQFLLDVFRERLAHEGIVLMATSAFREYTARLYPSTLYPVFVNLVDNAVHWLTGYGGERQVILDTVDGALIVMDTGPGIGERDREAVFELGFSRKPGGTGYGLYISRQVLRREGMDLLLDVPSPDRGARFRIVFGEAKDARGDS